ncbi:MAG: hypothetical protein E7655_00910 [Ruminococcaceae bacterium]|nr:hypothetical protein [Oscillospiraceae bacterium]
MSDVYKNMMDSAFGEYYVRFKALNALSKENAVTIKALFPEKRPLFWRDKMHKMLSMGVVKRVGFNRYWLDEARTTDTKAVLLNRLFVIVGAFLLAAVLLLLNHFGIIAL